MHVMDAIAAVLVLLLFAISGFDTTGGNDWGQFENQIAADDLSYTLKETGFIEDFVTSGSTGSLRTAVDGVSERSFDVSGEIGGVAPNLDIGFYRRPSQVTSASVTNVSSGDQCYSEVQSDLDTRSATPVLRTQAGGMQASNDGVTLYIGDYHLNEDLASQIDYDSVWVDRNDNCNFGPLHDPYEPEEIFQWGSGSSYEFRGLNVNVENWNGTLELAEAYQMSRFQETMSKEVNGIKNRVKIKSFTLEDSTEEFDFLIFPERETVERIEDRGQAETVNGLIDQKPVLFLANLNQSLVEDTFLQEQGFRWEDLNYRSLNSCTASDQEIDNCGDLEIGFSTTQSSQKTREMITGQDTDMESISLYPRGSIVLDDKGALSFDKTMYLENFAYSEISEDRVSTAMTEDTVTGRPSTHCDDATTGTFSFPDSEGSLQNMDVVNTQLGNSDSYCAQNNRALYIDRDGDEDYSDSNEGPFQGGERIDIRGLTYIVRIGTGLDSGCGTGECAGFMLDENAKLNLFTYNSDRSVGRAPYEENYSPEDRKALAAFIYMMAGSTEISGTGDGGISTSIYSSTEQEPFQINLRWGN